MLSVMPMIVMGRSSTPYTVFPSASPFGKNASAMAFDMRICGE